MAETSEKDQDSINWRAYRGKLGEEFRSGPVYKMKLNGPTPESFAIFPKNLRTGDAEIGAQLMSGHWRFGRNRIKVDPLQPPWDVPGPSRHFADRLHRFNWLPDLAAVGSEGLNFARTLILNWVQEFGRWNGFTWRITTTVDRLWNWLVSGPALLENLPPDGDVMESIARQARHIQISSTDYPEVRAAFRSLLVQLILAFAFREDDKRVAALEAQIELDLSKIILADGGHVTRNPEILLDVMLDLQSIDDLYLRQGRPTPPFLAKALTRISGMLKFLRCADGGLPVMNGGCEGRRTDLKNALFPYSGARAFAFATKTGIQKLEAGTTRLMLDVGHAPSGDAAYEAHAGCLSVEIDSGPYRLITNCGSHADIDPVWREATRHTSGHSALVLNDEDAAETSQIRSIGISGPEGPTGVSARRMEENDQLLIDAQHGAWKNEFGLIYRRRIFMEPDGNRIIGEDTLTRPVSQGTSEDTSTIPYTVRFHLHPSIRMRPEGPFLGLILPDDSMWLFKTNHKKRSIDRSVYLARGRLERCWQLVLNGEAKRDGDASTPENIIKWAMVKS